MQKVIGENHIRWHWHAIPLRSGPAPSCDKSTRERVAPEGNHSTVSRVDKRGAFFFRGSSYITFSSLPLVVLIGRISRPEAGYQVDEETNKSVRDGDAGRSEVEEQKQGVGESGVVGCELDGPADEQACERRDGRPKSCNQS